MFEGFAPPLPIKFHRVPIISTKIEIKKVKKVQKIWFLVFFMSDNHNTTERRLLTQPVADSCLILSQKAGRHDYADS
jgi:hypothetical protein